MPSVKFEPWELFSPDPILLFIMSLEAQSKIVGVFNSLGNAIRSIQYTQSVLSETEAVSILPD